MSMTISEAVKRGRAPKRQYPKTLPIPGYLSEALHYQAKSMGLTVTTLVQDVLERALPELNRAA
jgi:hypothetical protein